MVGVGQQSLEGLRSTVCERVGGRDPQATATAGGCQFEQHVEGGWIEGVPGDQATSADGRSDTDRPLQTTAEHEKMPTRPARHAVHLQADHSRQSSRGVVEPQ